MLTTISGKRMYLPDFVIFGGSKSGTNWMNECLREHPGVFLTREVHEIFFFDEQWDRGVEWYARYFRKFPGNQKIGDISPTYLAFPGAPERLKQVIPNAKLIVSLRNPLQRAWSKYLHMWRKGEFAGQPAFREACETYPQIIGDGEYGRCLQNWLRVFPRSQIHCFVLADARKDPFAFMRRLYETIGVDPDFRASKTTDKTNEHQTPRVLWLSRAAFQFSYFLHRHRLHWAVDSFKALGIKKLILHRGTEPEKDPAPMSEQDRAWLTERYQKDVTTLSEIVQRDLAREWFSVAVAA